MKWQFFKDKELNEHLAVYILSLLNPQSRLHTLRVNKNWYELTQLTQRYMRLLPTLRSIPMFSKVTLDVLRLKLMSGGMTNTTYRVKIGPDHEKILARIPGVDPQKIRHHKSKKWVVRVPGDVSLFSVDRKQERNNALLASKLGLNIPIAYFNEQGLQVTEFIEGIQVIDQNQLKRQDILMTLALKAKLLHSSQKFENETHVFERNKGLCDALIKKGFRFPPEFEWIKKKMNDLEQAFTSYQINTVPCHNDATPLNYILLSETTDEQGNSYFIFQIDWEYSSNNDFLWDLAYFAIEAKLSSEQEGVYLNAYFGEGKVTSSIKAWYSAYKPVVEWWITLWSWTQWAVGASSVGVNEYIRLGEERYQSTLAHLQSKAFNEAYTLIVAEQTEFNALTPRAF